MNFSQQVIWITGASSGIGEALAYACAHAGATLILSARRESELERVRKECPHPDRVHVVPLDLSKLEGIEDTVAEWHGRLGRIDMLINNGGISQRSLTQEGSLEVDRRIMEVNFFGQIILTKAVLPYMLAQKRGHFVVMSSLTGKFGFPLRSAYAASKHALHGFFESLYLESKGEGIQVTMVNPGRIKTQVSVNALTKDGTASGEMDPGQEAGLSATTCAARILRAVHQGRYEVTIGSLGERAMVMFKRYLPRLFHVIASRISAR